MQGAEGGAMFQFDNDRPAELERVLRPLGVEQVEQKLEHELHACRG